MLEAVRTLFERSRFDLRVAGRGSLRSPETFRLFLEWAVPFDLDRVRPSDSLRFRFFFCFRGGLGALGGRGFPFGHGMTL